MQLLSSRYTVPLRCSYCCCNSREHEFLDLRDFLYVWLNYYVPYRKLTGLFKTKQKTTLLHGQYPELKCTLYTGQLQGPKFCTCYAGRRLWPKCRFGVGNKNSLCENLHSCHIFKWFIAGFLVFVSHIPGQDVLKGLWRQPLWLLSVRSPLSREHVRADKRQTSWRQHSARRTKRNRISY
jgi:hypothetical protein